MFSVNVDKLIKMTEQEHEGYADLASTVLTKYNDDMISLGMVGDGLAAFKLAAALMEKGNKVLFIDADVEEDIFISKYRLGKSLKGITDFAKGEVEAKDLICVTNNEYLNLVFTGNVDDVTPEKFPTEFVSEFIRLCSMEYDMIVVQSDDLGRVAACCDASLLMIKDTEYKEAIAEARVDELDALGCYIMGIVVHA